MKSYETYNYLLFLVLAACTVSESHAQNSTSGKLHAGIIPYQWISRSTGAFVRYDLQWVAFEYRPTYTLPTRFVSNVQLVKHDWYYFNGMNNFLIVHFRPDERFRIGVIGGYRNWQYNKKLIYKEYENISHNFQNLQSGKLSGPCIGVDWSVDFIRFPNIAFVGDVLYTDWKGHTTTYYKDPGIEPRTRVYSGARYYSVSLGFKITIVGRIKK